MTEIPITMSGVVLTGHGGPEVLDFRTDLPVPVPAQGEVLVRVKAAGVNNTDINTRLAWYSKSDESSDFTLSFTKTNSKKPDIRIDIGLFYIQINLLFLLFIFKT